MDKYSQKLPCMAKAMKPINLRHVVIDPKDNRLVQKRRSPWLGLVLFTVVICIIAAVAVNF